MTPGRIWVALAMGSAGCSAAERKPAPRATDASDCPTAPVSHCDAAAPPSCFAGGDSGMPGDAGYPSGCTVFLPGPRAERRWRVRALDRLRLFSVLSHAS